VRHGLLLYDNDDVMVGKIAPFLREGLTAGESVIVIVDSCKRELLMDALAADGSAVSYVDRDSFYTRPEDALARYDARLRKLVREGAGAVRVFAELPCCDGGTDVDAWIRYEAVVNRALAHHPLWVVCGYDAREQPGTLMESALETHQEVLADQWGPSSGYRPPEAVVRSRSPQPTPLEDLRPLPTAGRPQAFRDSLSAELHRSGVPEAEAADMLVAAAEVLANAREHGGERVSARVGQVDDEFVCEVFDDGLGIDDPVAGLVPPRPGTSDTTGLWVARQLTRRLELVPVPGGFTVRLWTTAPAG
jgi:anti-sigma regulatory factor (Ser/Thr protein kinase)